MGKKETDFLGRTLRKIYIHNWPLERFRQDYGLACLLYALILYVSGGTYSLTSTLNDTFFLRNFLAGLFTLRVFARNLLGKDFQLNY